MSTTNDNKRQQLISKLREMFQMDQADLDFGTYPTSKPVPTTNAASSWPGNP